MPIRKSSQACRRMPRCSCPRAAPSSSSVRSAGASTCAAVSSGSPNRVGRATSSCARASNGCWEATIGWCSPPGRRASCGWATRTAAGGIRARTATPADGGAVAASALREAPPSDALSFGAMKPRIVITVPLDDYARRWRDEVAARLPEAEVFIDDGGRAVADYAIGWRPPADFFERVTGLRAFLSAAAGVDHLLGHPSMPADLPIARIEDGGMGAQMAEYCCAELFRFAQRRKQYEEQQARGVRKQLGYTPRRDITVGMFGIGVLGHCIATAIRGFGYSVIAAAGSNRVEDGIEVLGPDRREEFFARSRVLILIAPLTEATRGIINRETLGK